MQKNVWQYSTVCAIYFRPSAVTNSDEEDSAESSSEEENEELVPENSKDYE